LRLSTARGRLQVLSLQLTGAAQQRLDATRARFELAARTLHTVSPLATLARGFAIVTDEHDRALTTPTGLTVGARIHARLARGRLGARVESIEDDT
jgi:exodeoxyribonuclease VII large subunit